MGALRKLLMPKLGLTMQEGTVVEWPLAEGSTFAKGDVCVVIETDKVATEVEAQAAGRLVRILVPLDETVPVGATLAEWEPLDEESAQEDPATEVAAEEEHAPLSAAPAPAAPGWRKASASERSAARRMVEAKPGIPHFYLAVEIDAARLQVQREAHNGTAARRVSVTHLFVAAVARALVHHPQVNRVWENDGIRELRGADVGIAVHTPQGLVVPILRNAHALALPELAARATDLVTRARANALKAEDVGGGALTVSNAGMHQVTWMSSIINPGQSAILGIGAERQLFRPDAQGAPRLMREIGLVLSCDHRAHDGVGALAFLNEVKSLLEAPDTLFV